MDTAIRIAGIVVACFVVMVACDKWHEHAINQVNNQVGYDPSANGYVSPTATDQWSIAQRSFAVRPPALPKRKVEFPGDRMKFDIDSADPAEVLRAIEEADKKYGIDPPASADSIVITIRDGKYLIDGRIVQLDTILQRTAKFSSDDRGTKIGKVIILTADEGDPAAVLLRDELHERRILFENITQPTP